MIAGQAIIRDTLPAADQRTVKAMCLYAIEVADGHQPGPYSDQRALAYARARRLPSAQGRKAAAP